MSTSTLTRLCVGKAGLISSVGFQLGLQDRRVPNRKLTFKALLTLRHILDVFWAQRVSSVLKRVCLLPALSVLDIALDQKNLQSMGVGGRLDHAKARMCCQFFLIFILGR